MTDTQEEVKPDPYLTSVVQSMIDVQDNLRAGNRALRARVEELTEALQLVFGHFDEMITLYEEDRAKNDAWEAARKALNK